MQIHVNWTYEEFLLQENGDAHNQLFISSDDCCDYEHITIKENSNDKFDVQMRALRMIPHWPCLSGEQYSS
jgi:hypothetical protein